MVCGRENQGELENTYMNGMVRDGRYAEAHAGKMAQRFRGFRYRALRPRAVVYVFAPVALLAFGGAMLWGFAGPNLEAAEHATATARGAERDARGEIALLELENERLRAVHGFSADYRIPADLAEVIYDVALAEGLRPEVAFGLVQTESSFRRYAVSEAGATGYTQLLPSTAVWLDPTMADADLFDRETNLRLGFRYLRFLLEGNGGDLRLALLAYNRGPGRVRSIVARGGDPANGYARQVLGSD